MKKFLSVLLMVAGLMSCGDDDKPFIPELNKLTSVTCTKNGNAFFNANITYDQDKQINRIILNTEGNQFTDNYIGSPDKPGGLSIQLCKSEKKEFYIRYSS